MNNLTDNMNLLQPGNFKISIDNLETANLQFFCTNVVLPSLSKSAVTQNFRGKQAHFPGDLQSFDTMDVTFILDEDMRNYEEVYNWITDVEEDPKFKDITLSILSNRNTTNRQIRFHDAFPTNIGSITFSTAETDSDYMTCSVTFVFSYFEFIR